MQLTPQQLLNNPFLNKGTAFTKAERDQYGLNKPTPSIKPNQATLKSGFF